MATHKMFKNSLEFSYVNVYQNGSLMILNDNVQYDEQNYEEKNYLINVISYSMLEEDIKHIFIDSTWVFGKMVFYACGMR